MQQTGNKDALEPHSHLLSTHIVHARAAEWHWCGHPFTVYAEFSEWGSGGGGFASFCHC